MVKDTAGAESSVPGILGMNIICRCYKELFGAHSLSFLEVPSVLQSPGPVLLALQQCHHANKQHPVPRVGAVRVQGPQVVQVPGGVVKMVASTYPDAFCGQLLLFEPQILAYLLDCWLLHVLLRLSDDLCSCG